MTPPSQPTLPGQRCPPFRRAHVFDGTPARFCVGCTHDTPARATSPLRLRIALSSRRQPPVSLQDPPRISVIVPAYNVGPYIGAAIASLRCQTFPGFEALVIDDGSADDTRQQALAAIGGDGRFRLIHQENRGLSGARNAGLDLARAPVIAFLDGDDRFAPTFLQRLHDTLHSTGADWVACGLAFCTPDGVRHPHSAIHGQPEPRTSAQAVPFALDDWAQVICHFPSAWNKLYRRAFIGDLRFDEGTWYEDHTFFHRLAAKSRVLHHLSDPLYLYTLDRDGQITRADSDRVFDQIPVLETSAAIFHGADKSGADTGLARLATRLFCERLEVIRSPQRAARFRQAAAGFLARHRLAPEWTWDRHLDALQACSLSGHPPVTIRHDAADGEDITPDLLPDPTTPLAPFFQLSATDHPIGPHGLVIDLPGFGQVDPTALADIAGQLLHSDLAAVLITQPSTPQPHANPLSQPRILSPDTALDLTPDRHALLVKAAFACQPVSPVPQLRLAEQALRLCAAQAPVACAQIAVAAPRPITPPRLPTTLPTTLNALDRWCAAVAPLLPPGGARRLFLRHATLWLAQNQPRGTLHRLRLALTRLRIWRIGKARGWIGAPGTIDADTLPVLQQIFRLPPAG
ncbi:glycosyltransferase family 2 protein [Pseudotabrizicola sediminis]|uniref:Glycosyltransferase family 2 protein n=1 Tax=Pseudotabrizicola sediminis TaxID=2486418 RepID=A0ABY2KN26_9RHOB|nr:glycosyltransferase family 2 protein [Pseudotabrizicola sediminis]